MALTSLVVGCGGDDDDDDTLGVDAPSSGAIGSCDVIATAGSCVDYVGSIWTATTAEQNCGQIPNSTYASGACPSANRVGSCVADDGGPGEYQTSFYSPLFTAAIAQMACTGTWIP